jgi:hypothetical protein
MERQIYDPAAEKQIQAAPLPSQATLRRRQNVLTQFFKFIAMNLRMVYAASAH